MPSLLQLTEKLARPGLLGLPGKLVETRCARDLASYFTRLAGLVANAHLEHILDGNPTVEVARHSAQMRIFNLLRHQRPVLQKILAVNIHQAMLVADGMSTFGEAEKEKTGVLQINQIKVTGPGNGIDQLGLTGEEAAAYAQQYAATQVAQIDKTTSELIADAVARGINDMLGVPATARLIRQIVDDMSVGRAQTIASTEMNDAMSKAAVRKLKRLGIAYKQWILSPDACPICEAIVDNQDAAGGAIPVDQPFVDDDDEEYDRPPAHPNCRCAVTGARAPDGEDDEENEGD